MTNLPDKAWLTVPYMPNPILRRQTVHTLNYLPEDYIYKVAIINKGRPKLMVHHQEVNDKNILSRAWNKGLRYIFSRGYDKALVTNLDILINIENVDALYKAQKETDADIIGASVVQRIIELKTATRIYGVQKTKTVEMQRNDGSFSCFLITKKAFETVGDFDENFVPCYFEDDDYLLRAKAKKLKCLRSLNAFFYHDVQISLKEDKNTQKHYNEFMKRNQEYFNRKHNQNVKMF